MIPTEEFEAHLGAGKYRVKFLAKEGRRSYQVFDGLRLLGVLYKVKGDFWIQLSGDLGDDEVNELGRIIDSRPSIVNSI